MHSARLRGVVASLSFLGSFGFITHNLGHFSAELNELLALVLLAIFGSMHVRLKGTRLKDASRKQLVGAAVSLGLFMIIWATGGEVEQALGVTFLVLSLRWAGEAIGNPQPRLTVYLLTALLIGVYVILYQRTPVLWVGLQGWSQWYSHLITLVPFAPLRLGATASGLHILVFYLLYVLSCFSLSTPTSWRSLAGFLGLGIAANVLYVIAHAPLLIPLLKLFLNQYHLGHSHYQAYTLTSLNTPAFFLALLAVPVFLLETAWRYEPQPVKWRLSDTRVWGASLVFLGMFVLSLFPTEGRPGGRVLLYDKGYLDWARPVFGRYGERSGGMFGMLPEFLEAGGFSVGRSPVISEDVLNDYDTLVVINLQQSFTPEEQDAIWRFVGNGGSLLALGDHTGLAGIRDPFNELLKPVAIEFNFDSAHYINDWDHSFEAFRHPITRGWSADREFAISIGASLNIPPSAQPIIVGKYGFSDIGNANNAQNAFLGDRKYNSGELLGDIVLVASAPYGRGKVLVFGDTSSFQNSALVVSHEFVRRTFNWLADSWLFSGFSASVLIVGLLSLLAGLGLALWRTADVHGLASYLAGAILLAIVCSAAIQSVSRSREPLRGNIAYIDTSHMERVSFRYEADDAFLGLSYNLIRNGFLPIEMKRFSEKELRAGKLHISIAPSRGFSASEVAAIKRFIEDGGSFLLCAGWEDSFGSQTLLETFGLDLQNTPLGPIEPESNTARVRFYNAWPISVGHPEVTDIVSAEESSHPLIVKQARGAGRFILIGDSGFLSNINLESFRSARRENVEFLRGLLQPGAVADSAPATAHKE